MTEESRVAYFLGELSESESRRLEEESLRNEDLFDQLQSTEEALIDAYVRGEMTAESQTLFERNYLNTNRRREGVELATALRRKFNSRGISADRSSSASLVTRRRKVLAASNVVLAIAAVLLIVIAVGWWGVWHRQNASQTQANNSGATPAPPASTPMVVPSPTATIPQQSTNSPAPTPTGSQSPSLQSPPKAPDLTAQRSPAYATFTLLPGAVRSEGATGKVLTISSAVNTVRLQLILRENLFTTYRAELQTPEGSVVSKHSGLEPNSAGTQRMLFVEVDARLLESKHYVLVVYGDPESQPGEPAAEYTFRVNKE